MMDGHLRLILRNAEMISSAAVHTSLSGIRLSSQEKKVRKDYSLISYETPLGHAAIISSARNK